MQKTKFIVNGMQCNSCALLIEERLQNKQGILKVKVNLESKKASVAYDENKINENDILREVELINNFKTEKIGDESETAKVKTPEAVVRPFPNEKSRLWILVPMILLTIFFGLKDGKTDFTNKVNGQKETADIEQNAKQPSQDTVNNQVKTAQNIVKSDKPILEAYIVSNCPFGLQMQRVMADVIKNAPTSKENMKVRYMGSVSGNTITSMHGDKEAQENLKQICIREEQKTKYWDYVSCYMKKGDTQGCLSSTGVNTAKLDSCLSDSKKGLAYAQEDFALNQKYGIKGSPTLIMGGVQVSEFDFGGRTTDAVKTVLCNGFNKQPGFCSAKLTTANAAASFSETY